MPDITAGLGENRGKTTKNWRSHSTRKKNAKDVQHAHINIESACKNTLTMMHQHQKLFPIIFEKCIHKIIN